MRPYNPRQIEAHWQTRWQQEQRYRLAGHGDKPKFYVLDMFPYPSGKGLHVGHLKGYVSTDIIARYKRMQGFDVLHPMGWDSFGLPTERQADKEQIPPAEVTKRNIAVFRQQLQQIGLSYDWNREFATSDPTFYRWTQWIVLKLHERGLAYQADVPVNWCPQLGTVLANEEVRDGVYIETGDAVERRVMRQWMLKITAYADRLLEGLERLEWPERVKELQRNWIGRSEGAIVRFAFASTTQEALQEARQETRRQPERQPERQPSEEEPAPDDGFEVFTTRVDTLFGCTFCVLSPEHPLSDALLQAAERRSLPEASKLKTYLERARQRSERERSQERLKTGIPSGFFVINPANQQAIPLWIAEYVLMGYGTGAVMGVPAHDTRDHEFATRYDLPIVAVVEPETSEPETSEPETSESAASAPEGTTAAPPHELPQKLPQKLPYMGEGRLVRSAFLDGLNVAEAKRSIVAFLSEHGAGRAHVTYNLRDWLFSRQRYWGEPIPFVHVADAQRPERPPRVEAVAEADLPVLLPARSTAIAAARTRPPAGTPAGTPAENTPNAEIRPPLSHAEAWVNSGRSTNGSPAQRETNVMPQWAGSSWYYLRFIDPHNTQAFCDKTLEKRWMPVDLYVGGIEHATLHLLYARFWHKVLFDLGLVSSDEPFKRLLNQGMLHTTSYQDNQGRYYYPAEVERRGEQFYVKDSPKDATPLFTRVEKMSKSKCNVVSPEEVLPLYGADSLRLYEVFMAPLTDSGVWQTSSMAGMGRFLRRCWKLFHRQNPTDAPQDTSPKDSPNDSPNDSQAVLRMLHQTIRKVTADIETLHLNTALSQLMICLNFLARQPSLSSATLSAFLRLLSPFAPHLAEELWQHCLGQKTSIHAASWPTWDARYTEEAQVTVVVQVNGKLRARLDVPKGASKAEVQTAALANPAVQQALEGASPASIRRVVHVPDRLLNIVSR